jgi:hypothetical protein
MPPIQDIPTQRLHSRPGVRLRTALGPGLGAAAWLTMKPGEAYRFLHEQSVGKTPVAYSSCRPDPELSTDALGAAGSYSVIVPNGQRAYVSGKMELDAETQSGVNDFSAGELVGLAALGKGTCSTDR